MAQRTYKLLYKIAYRHNKMWKYARFNVKAGSLKEAKSKVKKSHPKATMLKFVEQLKW